MSIDTIERLLQSHGAAGAPPTIIEHLRLLHQREGEIDASGYLPKRAIELKREERNRAADVIAVDISQLQSDLAVAEARTIAQQDQQTRERVRASASAVIDVGRITRAANVAEIVVLLNEAEGVGPAELRRVWEFARPVLHALRVKEFRNHVIGTSSTAFSAFVVWEAKVKSVAHRHPDRAQLSAEVQRRQREILTTSLAACRALNLDAAVEAAIKRVAIPEAPKSTTTAGGWFDRFGKR